MIQLVKYFSFLQSSFSEVGFVLKVIGIIIFAYFSPIEYNFHFLYSIIISQEGYGFLASLKLIGQQEFLPYSREKTESTKRRSTLTLQSSDSKQCVNF